MKNFSEDSIVNFYGGFSDDDYTYSGFYPDKDLLDGLERVVIFPEQTRKHSIPNGSVWAYDINTPYLQRILKSDVGCGMTMAVIKADSQDADLAKSIFETLKTKNIKIGRGNHFLNLMSNHPKFPGNTSTLLLHSDFNWKNNPPNSYSEAFSLMKSGQEIREETLDLIIKKSGVEGVIYRDWTHNSVEFLNDTIIYRKGLINLGENEGEGLLAMNPCDGVLLYVGDNPTSILLCNMVLVKKLLPEKQIFQKSRDYVKMENMWF